MSATSLSDVDIQAIKTRQQGTWASGDYAVIGTTLQITGELLCEAVDIAAGERVLDVAAGNGNAALAAAPARRRRHRMRLRAGAPRTSASRAAADGLDLHIHEADAEAMPFETAGFDAVLSTFGVMFCPDHERVAAELIRVCKPDGRIGMTNWTPEGFIGQMFKIVGRYVPPPAGLGSPLDWGTRSRLAELFGGDQSVRSEARRFVFRYRSAEHWLRTFRDFYGPMHRAFASLDPPDAAALESDLLALARQHNTATRGSLRIASDYLEVVVTPCR